MGSVINGASSHGCRELITLGINERDRPADRSAADRGRLTLAIAGDVMLGRLVNEAIQRYGFAYPWGDLPPVLQQADLFAINLECTLTSETKRWEGDPHKPFFFRADRAAIETLLIGGVDFASLANNHIGDFGTVGLLETIATLDQASIAHAGAGADFAAAQAPARLTARGCRIAVVAFADYPEVWAATPTSPGLNYIPLSLADEDVAEVRRVIASARQDADLVLFSIHWGPNMRPRPPAHFREFARRVIEAGADIFWGHSAHVVQGVEVHHGKPILYDTGDFIDDYRVDMELRNDLSALFLVRIEPPAIRRIDLVPVHIDAMRVNLAAGAERDWILRRLAALCAELGTQVVDGPRELSIFVAT